MPCLTKEKPPLPSPSRESRCASAPLTTTDSVLHFSIFWLRLGLSEQLNIKVKDADGNEVFFKVKRQTRLSKLKRAYAERMGKPENAVRFITADGSRVGDDDTAETVSVSGKYLFGL